MSYTVLIPTPRCDECGDPVEEHLIRRSVRNGVAIGPWLDAKCEVKNSAEFAGQVAAYERQIAAQNSYFESVCNEVDPKLAEAIHQGRG